MKSAPRAVLATAVASLALISGVLAAPAPAHAQAAEHVRGELVVKYRLGTSSVERDQIRRAADVGSVGVVDGQTQTVRVGGGQTADAAAARLETDPRVLHAV